MPQHRALLQQTVAGYRQRDSLAKVSARGAKIFAQGKAIRQKCQREDEIIRTELFPYALRINHWNDGFDSYRRWRVNWHNFAAASFNGICVEIIGFELVIGVHGDDEKIWLYIRANSVQQCAEAQDIEREESLGLELDDFLAPAEQPFATVSSASISLLCSRKIALQIPTYPVTAIAISLHFFFELRTSYARREKINHFKIVNKINNHT